LTNLVKQGTMRAGALPEGGMKGRKRAGKVHEPVSLYDAKTRLSELVEDAASGAEITIMKSGRPRARLVPLEAPDARRLRKPGKGKGEVRMARDFDAPLTPDLLRLFGAVVR
jgi:prevent-host-death family protein